ncbi:MAG TPA: hypothetical protein VER55_04150, partial [Ardenticatenaceae bacterium]|nr:hypothetical protein [Ardenticatenaceae bacterium]
PRFMDRVAKADTGVGPIPIVDMGAYEARLIFVDDDGVDFGKGTSWETAVTDLQYALSLAKSGDEIWMAAGTYVPALLTSDSSRGISFEIKSGVAIFGGFAGGETHASQRDWTVNVTVLSGDLEGDDITDANGVVPHAGGIAGMNSFQVVDASGTDATTILDGVTITGGDAHGNDFWYGGGGMYSSEGSLTVANVTFRGNRAESTGGGLCILQGDPKLVNVTFIGNRGGGGGGMYDAASHLKLTDVTFIGNSAYSGGGMATISSNAVLTNITFIGNSANEGGGLVSAGGGGATLVNVSFKGNAGRIGGGMYNESANPSLANVIFSGNSARRGGALYNNEGRPTLSHVTFSKNAARRGGAIYNVFRSHPTVHNSILWDNGALAIFNDPDDPDPDNQSSATVGYSLIQGGYSGRGNVDADPHFLDADGADDKAGTADDDLRLHPSSPAVDAGNNGFVPVDGFDLDGDGRRRERLPLDFDDAPRFVDIAAKADSGAGTPPIVDMGAFETQAGGHVATPTRAPTTTATVTGTPATTRTATATQPATVTRTPTTTATQPATATRTPTTTATRTTRATQTSTSTPRDTTTPTSTTPSTPRGTGTATATRMASATSAATTTATPITEARLLFLPLIQRGP